MANPLTVGFVIMSSTAEPHNDGFHVVVAEDGSVRAADLASLGLGPGMHLRVVPEQRGGQRRSARGMFAHLVKPGDMDDFEAAMAQSKAERVAALTADVEA